MKLISDRGRLRKEAGRLHLLALQKERGDRCEICGGLPKDDQDFARFHIMTVAAHPKLEFFDKNILVYVKSHWWQCHEPYHHDRDSKSGQKIMKRIHVLCGVEDYRQYLTDQEKWIGKHDELYLRAKIEEFKQRLK